MGSYIPDGYTREGYIKPAVTEDSGLRLHDSLSFQYRAATRLEVIKLDAEVKIANRNSDLDPGAAVRAEQLACKFLADRLISWDLAFQGQVLPITTDTLSRLQPFLFSRLYNVVRGLDTGDRREGVDGDPKTDEEQLKN